MERVETLLKKLQEQLADGASAAKMLVTVQMMQHELMHLQQQGSDVVEKEAVAISMPVQIESAIADIKEETVTLLKEEEKIIEVLQIDEAEVEAELEEIKRNAAAVQQMVTNNKPQSLFDLHSEDIPTLPRKPAAKETDKKEINDIVANESLSLNETLSKHEVELSSKLIDAPIKDLKKAIGINDRFTFINELFRGDEVMYERSIKTINSFSILPEAEYWIRRELKTKLGWNDKNETVVIFDQLVKRRFS